VLTSYRAAWVPDDDVQRDWNDAACLAIDWIEAEAVKQGTHAVLVTSTFGGPILTYAFSGRILNSPLSRYVRGRTHFTPRSGRHVPRGVAVLSFVPTRRALDFAIELAQGSSLCVVESATEPVAGWAADVGAINLLAGFATAQHPPTFLEHLTGWRATETTSVTPSAGGPPNRLSTTCNTTVCYSGITSCVPSQLVTSLPEDSDRSRR